MALKKKIISFFPLLSQLIRFTLVGLLAAGVHFTVLIFIVEMAHVRPLLANLFAFMISFQVSYWGHRIWTFRGTTITHRIAFPRLFFVAGSGMVANESLFYVFLTLFNLPYPVAQLIVSAILPLANFTLGKLWVFR